MCSSSKAQRSKYVQSLLIHCVSVVNTKQECGGIVALDEELFFVFVTRESCRPLLLKTAYMYSQSMPTLTPSACQTTLFHCLLL